MSDLHPPPLGYDYFADASGARSLAHSSEVGIRFQTQQRTLERIEQSLNGIPARVRRLSDAGVAIPLDVDEAASALADQLAAVGARATSAMNEAQARFQPQIEQLLAAVERNDAAIAESGYEANAAAIVAAKAQADALRTGVEAAEEAIGALIGEVGNPARALDKRLHALDAAAERLRASGITLSPGERLHLAATATLTRDGEVQRGAAFLTDQRLLFERNEEVVRRARFLPIPRREQVQEITLELPRAGVSARLALSGDALELRGAGQLALAGAEEEWLAQLEG